MSSSATHAATREITRELAAYATRSKFSALPANVQAEAVRAFMNWVGCSLGGSREQAVHLAVAVADEAGGHKQSSIIGHGKRTDVASAAFINCISSSILAFDDAHLPTVAHPSGPVASALFALSEKLDVSGEEFLSALALGIELTCRVSNLLCMPPSKFHVGFYVTGVTGPIGVAAAMGRLLKLDEQKMAWAIALGASQSSGFRATHGTMTGHFRPGHASRCGVVAALLAAKGFDSSEHALEDENGLFDVLSSGANYGLAVDGLGQHFEIMQNAYKPYPCGIVIHPTIDACLEIKQQLRSPDDIGNVMIRVNPVTIKLTGVREPTTPLEAHISVYHWVAAALLRGRAGLAETQLDCIHEPEISALRARVEATPDPTVQKGESIVEVTRPDGTKLRSHVKAARGSATRPMTDAELDAKFREQANFVLAEGATEKLHKTLRGARSLRNVGKDVAAAWQG